MNIRGLSMGEKGSQHSAREQLKESLSVSLDGQASDLELRRVIDSIGRDDDLRTLASRYQLIGETLRGKSSKFAKVDISKGVMAALEQEEVDNACSQNVRRSGGSSENGPGTSHFISDVWASLGKVAVAASVAFAVVIGVRNSNQSPDLQVLAENEPATLTQPVQLAQSGQNDYGVSGIRAGYHSKQHDSITPEQLAYAQNLADRATRERFHAYALQHAELSAMGSGQSILSFARLTSFDNQ
ncbi:sigma-E factor negative regulatory protein [Endozoicomonas sp. SCSIO W0465]|uniref:sigma-E factor negative regulatory protein n=1 Tax=Endozoicomonas sp. SCSIO W0465 TaxID=2918516 RepID=UPI0020760C0B|nr:sigma-E factor negative regulatory protein [Endozoicomonas sp. SCSIO W0465]USE39061.1 sigma-E factor negative regulatory protein [Endozoicomonas sp. SCSIO W0465]